MNLQSNVRLAQKGQIRNLRDVPMYSSHSREPFLFERMIAKDDYSQLVFLEKYHFQFSDLAH